MDRTCSVWFVLFVPPAVLAGSHSLTGLLTYTEEHMPFPKFSFVLMLDDITVGYYDSELKSLAPRGLDKEQEDDGVITQDVVETLTSFVRADLNRRHQHIKSKLNYTNNTEVQQVLAICELSDNDQPGPMIMKNALRGITQDELRFHAGNLTYQNSFNFTKGTLKILLPLIQLRQETLYYPSCIKTLRGYLKKRYSQVKRKVKPRVRLLQRRRSVSGWDGITCLATGFYPRHINLTILRDGQPVPDHLTTGGDLLPNGDGTYQMRRNLELREEELKEKQDFTCTVTHLSLDNKLDVHLDLDPGEPIVSILSSVVVALVSVIVMVVVIWMIKRKKGRGLHQSQHSPAARQKKMGHCWKILKTNTEI